MSAPEPSPFPLVGLHAVSNAHNAWVALVFDLSPADDAIQASLSLLGHPDALASLAPLDCILPIPDPLRLEASHLASLPPNRVILRVPAAACLELPVQKKCKALADMGYRIMVDGVAAAAATQSGARSLLLIAPRRCRRCWRWCRCPARTWPAASTPNSARPNAWPPAFPGSWAATPSIRSPTPAATTAPRAGACWRCSACWPATPIRASSKSCSSKIRRWPTTCSNW